jgi:Fe-S-cluster containining protein
MQSGGIAKLQAIAQHTFSVTDRAIKSKPSVEGLARLVKDLDLAVDSEIAQIQAQVGKNLDCREGCSHCCYRVISCTLPEVIRVASHILETFSNYEIGVLHKRLYQYEREVIPSFGLDLYKLRPACPLLVDGRCSVYEARPLECRAMNSEDVSACARFKEFPNLNPGIPMIKPQVQVTEAVTHGLVEASKANGLVFGLHDLGRALKVALDEPDAMQGWVDNVHSFAPARSEVNQEEVRPKLVTPIQRSYLAGEEPRGSFDSSGLRLAEYLAEKGDTRGAIESIKGSHPGSRLAKARLPLAYESTAEVLEWRAYFQSAIREFAASSFDPKEAFDGLAVFRAHDLSYQQFNNRELLGEIGDLMCNGIAARALPSLCAPIEGPRNPGKIRVGYVGYDLRLSSLSPWTLGWLKNQSSDFETFAINLGEIQDRTTLEFKRYASHYFHLPRRRPVPEDARFIKSLNLDVLIFLDVGTKARTNQLACLRLARVQCAAWGAPETSGLPTIDYYLSSEGMEPSDGDDHYTEKLVRLPGSGVCYLREDGGSTVLEKRDFGIEGPLIVNVQVPSKFDPQWDHLYRSINDATVQPILFVDRPGQDRRVTKDRMLKAGIRAKYVPHLSPADYRGLLKIADVVLDSPGWNGGITTIHALDLGRPVVTLRTELRRGRQSACFLELTGAPGLIAPSESDYVDLASNPDRLHEASRPMDSGALYDDRGAVLALEQFMREISG